MASVAPKPSKSRVERFMAEPSNLEAANVRRSTAAAQPGQPDGSASRMMTLLSLFFTAVDGILGFGVKGLLSLLSGS